MIKKLWLMLFTIIIALSFACVNPGDDDDKDKEKDKDKKTDEEVFTRPDVGNDGINAGKAYGWDKGNIGPLTATITGNVTSAQYFYAKGLDAGWNAGNSLDASATDETAWGNAQLNQALFNGVKNAGFTVVRIPVTWGNDTSNQATRLARVKVVVGYAHTAGLAVIINTHHDNGVYNLDTALNQSSNTTITQNFTTLWTSIANEFKEYGEWLIFEPLNEPRVQSGGTTYWNGPPAGKEGVFAVLNGWNQAFVTAVRATGGNNAHRFLVVKGYAAKPHLVIERTTIPTDTSPNKLILDFHYYNPEGFTLNGTSFSWNVEDNGSMIRYDFEDVYNKFKSEGLPIIIGECGASWQGKRTGADAAAANESRNAYHEYVGRVAMGNGMTPILWDNGNHNSSRNDENSGLFNRNTGATNSDISKAAIDALLAGVRADK